MAGCLFIVPTPIGNLKDITLRAIETLEQVDWIAAEDTRHSKKLLQHFAIHKPMISLHDHNEQSKAQNLLTRLQQGEQGALISDAGTPLISDPGYHLVKLLRAHSVSVVPLPGPSALITALSASGLATDRFSFEGFIPAKRQKKQDFLQALVSEPQTLIFYESPHRLLDTLNAMQQVFGAERKMTLAKELTKQYERFVTGTIAEVIRQFDEAEEDWVRGEFVLMLAGWEDETVEQIDYDDLLHIMLAQSLPVKQISEMVSQYLGVNKKAVYQRCLQLNQIDNS